MYSATLLRYMYTWSEAIQAYTGLSTASSLSRKLSYQGFSLWPPLSSFLLSFLRIQSVILIPPIITIVDLLFGNSSILFFFLSLIF